MSHSHNYRPLMCLLGLLFSCSGTFADEDSTTKSVTKKVEVTVNKSSIQDGDDAEPQTTVSGKIVIVGPDGKRHEYDLGDKLPEDLDLDLKGIANGIMISGDEEDHEIEEPRFMIGVICQPATKLLRSHLKLHEKGLVVTRVSKEMAAAKAGIVAGDILLGTGESDFKQVADLVAVVADSNGKAITIRRLHHGDHSEVIVTPEKSTNRAAISAFTADPGDEDVAGLFDSMGLPRRHREILKKLGDNKRFQIQSLGPAIEIDDFDDFENFRGNFAEIISKGRRRAKNDADNSGTGSGDELDGDDEGETLRDQIKQLKAQMKRLEKRLESLNSDE